MTDEPPVPNDSFGSLFDFASWLYPRVWTGFVLTWAVTLLPVGVLTFALDRVGLSGGVIAAVRDGAWGRAALFAGMQFLYWGVLLFHGWVNLSLVEAVSRGGESSLGDALSRTGARLPAQVWTLAHAAFRILPLALAGGVAAGLTFRDSPLTAAGALGLIALPASYFTVRWSLSSFVALLEGLSGGAALRRSAELSGGRFWLYSFQFCLFHVLVIVPSVILSVGGLKLLPAWAAGLFASGASAILIAPFSCGLYLALYWREAARAAPAAAQ